MSEKVKALAIGSGFGGSIAAYRLGKAGIETVVLERGKRWEMTDAQDTFATYRDPDGRAAWLSEKTVLFTPEPINRYTGIVEQLIEDGITVWTASGVGGGSLVYNTVLLQPTEASFYQIFPQSISYEEMDTVYYPRVIEKLNASPIPDDVLETDFYLSSRIFLEQADKANLPTMRLNIGSDWQVVRQEIQGKKKPAAIAGEIWYGINSGCKNSLDQNYLKEAEETGFVDVRPFHVVTGIFEDEAGYRVTYDQIDESGKVVNSSEIVCSYLFMGAGSMGTSKLLTRARSTKTLPQLNEHIGKEWGNNGDTFAVYSAGKPTNGGQGGPASVAIRHEDNPHGAQTIIVFPEWDSPEQTLTFLGMSIPQDTGEFRYDATTDSVKLHWPHGTPGTQKLLDTVNYTLSLLDEVREQEPSPESLQEFSGHYQSPVHGFPDKTTSVSADLKTTANSGVTAHPLGGAVMGKACDLYGRVQGYSGLYVVDGALIPRGTAACNPALTIAAFAERCLDKILAEDIC